MSYELWCGCAADDWMGGWWGREAEGGGCEGGTSFNAEAQRAQRDGGPSLGLLQIAFECSIMWVTKNDCRISDNLGTFSDISS